MAFCIACGNNLGHPPVAFCTACGQSTGSPAASVMMEQPVAAPPATGANMLLGPGRIYRLGFYGEASPLLLLYLKTFLLSLITLGIYSFWGRAEIRRYLHAHTDLDGHRFAFHGTGAELAKGALKILGVILVLLAQSFIWPLVLGEGWGDLAGSLVLYVLAALLGPYALVGTWRYRLSRTSYRGIRFGFRGTVGELFPLYLKGLGLTIVTVGIYSPVFAANLRRFFCRHARYGNVGFDFDGDGASLIGSLLISRVLLFFTLGISLFWYRVVKFRFNWDHTTFQGARFRTNVDTADMLILSIVNVLVTVLTLGLGAAWAQVRYLRYVMERIYLDGMINLDNVVQFAQSADAAGETLSGFLDVEGMDLGL